VEQVPSGAGFGEVGRGWAERGQAAYSVGGGDHDVALSDHRRQLVDLGADGVERARAGLVRPVVAVRLIVCAEHCHARRANARVMGGLVQQGRGRKEADVRE